MNKKITKTKEEANTERELVKAKRTCPYCNIDSGEKSLVKWHLYRIEEFECRECGCVWEVEE